jgi:hypothetical protein
MAYTTNPQYKRNTKERQEQSEFKRRSIGDVRQDNSAATRYSIASRQPYRASQGMLSHPLDINSDRSKKYSARRRFRPATTWLEEPVRDEVDRIAQREGIARSKALRNLITWAVHQKLHLQTAALIPAVIEQSFDKVVGKRLARTDNLLVRAALDISQTRTIATNTLGRQPGSP